MKTSGMYEATHEGMKTSGNRSSTLLMKHVDPFCRFGFDDAVSDHVPEKISRRSRI